MRTPKPEKARRIARARALRKRTPPLTPGEVAQIADTLRNAFTTVIVDGSGARPVIRARGHTHWTAHRVLRKMAQSDPQDRASGSE